VQTFDFDQYLVKFEKIMEGYENMIFDIVSADGVVMFKSMVAKMQSVEVARCIIAMLYLAMKGRVELEQQEDPEDVKLLLANRSSHSR